jgi:hypothetical protein
MNKFYVHYVTNSTPTLKEFKTLKSAQDFVKKFNKKFTKPQDGWWVDYIVVGKLLQVDEYYQDQL